MMMSWILAAALALTTPDVQTPAAPPEPEQVMAVPPELRARLQHEVVARSAAGAPRLQRLIAFLFEPEGLGLQYRDGATHTVAEAYATRQVNCLSFTLLFLALAREAELQAYAQQIDDVLAWYLQGDIVYRSNHVNGGVLIRGKRYTVDVNRDAVIARHAPHAVTDLRALAHYYNNRAADLMERGQTAAAMPYMRISLDLDPGYATSWSNLGVLQLRQGDRAAAEQAYLKALTLDADNVSALFNLVSLYRRNGDRKREAVYLPRLQQAQRSDPFHQFLLAIGYDREGDVDSAVKHYRRAIRLLPNEYRFHAALAQAYARLGRTWSAQLATRRAHALCADRFRAAAPADAAAGGTRTAAAAADPCAALRLPVPGTAAQRAPPARRATM